MAKSQEETPSGHDQSLLNLGTSDASLTGGDQSVSSMARDCLLRLDTLCFYEEDKEEITEGAKKKKRVARLVGRGLRQFSVTVYTKIEAKRRTTYSEVADEIVAEISADGENDNITQYDQKNIRRRVYDAFNVLLAIGVIARDRKEIRWVGFPDIRCDLEEIVEERANLLTRIQEKVQYLQELEEQFVGLKNLMLRNEQLHKSENVPPEGITLPFILVQTRPEATVEIEISEDRQLVHFDFNGTPFSMHDDAHVLQEMRTHQAASPPHDVQKSPTDLRSKLGNKESHRATFSWSAGPTAAA